MALGIKKDTLSFEILPVMDSRIMLFLDTSEYKEPPVRPLLEVTLPGHARYTLVNIVAETVNVLNSNLVGYSKLLSTSSPAALPDGVYTLKYKICPYDLIYVQKYELRTTQLDCTIRQIHQYMKFSDCRVSDEEALKKEVVDLSLLVQTGIAEAQLGNPKRASDLYQKAHKRAGKIIDRLSKCC